MSDRYEHHSHCVFNLGYHIIFCPKYRRKLLQWGIDERLKILLVEKAARMECRIEKMEVMPDHLHIFIKIPPTRHRQAGAGTERLHGQRPASRMSVASQSPMPLVSLILRREYRSYLGRDIPALY